MTRCNGRGPESSLEGFCIIVYTGVHGVALWTITQYHIQYLREPVEAKTAVKSSKKYGSVLGKRSLDRVGIQFGV